MNIWLLGALVGVMSASAWAAERHWLIHSKYDTYELVMSGGNGTVGGKPANLTHFLELVPVLTNTLANDCPPLKPPADVTVKEGGQTRYIYIGQGTVTDGKECLNVGGEGLLYFPVHRDFLVGPKRDSIALTSPLKVFRNGAKIMELKKSGKDWINADTDTLLNWDFIERFENSLKDFDVRFRALPDLGQNKPKMILQSGSQSYEFYKITTTLWAVKKPGSHWIESSDTWSFWYDFDKDVLEDRFAPQIRVLEDKTKPKEERIASVQKLEGTWSRNLRDLYHRFVLDKDELPEIKNLAFRRLKAKPSMATAGVMAQYLKDGDDEDFKRSASQILKIQNPKGPLYKPGMSEGERAKTIEFWSRWWSQNQNAP